MWQLLIVAAIVLAATMYVLWALLPTHWRLRATHRIARWARITGRPGMLASLAAALERASQARPGDCSDCGAIHTKSRSTSSTPNASHRADDRRPRS